MNEHEIDNEDIDDHVRIITEAGVQYLEFTIVDDDPEKAGQGQRGAAGQGQRGPSPAQMAMMMIHRFDRDGDKALNPQELTAALMAIQQQQMRGQGQQGQQGAGGRGMKGPGGAAGGGKKGPGGAGGGKKGPGGAGGGKKGPGGR